MTKGQVVDWFQQTAAQIQQVSQIEESINKIKGVLSLAEAAGDTNQVMKMTEGMRQQQSILEKFVPVVLARTKTTDMDRARAFLQDFQLKWEQSEQEYSRWREGYARMELLQVNDGFSGANGEELRVKFNDQLNAQQKSYEAAFKLVVDSIPSSVGIIHV